MIEPSAAPISPAKRRKRRHQRPQHGRDRHVALFGRQLRRQLRIEQRHDDDVEHVEPGQHDAGKEGAGVELDHGNAGGGTVENEHDARRNENAEAAAGANHARGNFHVVAGAQHRRECQQPHQRDAGADDARCGREDRAGRQRGERERGRHRAGRELQRTEQAVEDVGALDDVAHEDEQRNRDQHVVRHHRIGALDEQVEDEVAHREVAEEHAERHQRERDREAEHDENDEHPEHDHAQLGIADTEHQISPLRSPISSSSFTTW